MSKLVLELIEHLEKLQRVTYSDVEASRSHHHHADSALQLIFYIERDNQAVTEQQRATIAKNLVAAVKPIQINIERHAIQFMKQLDNVILVKRSALQFLIDRYGPLTIPGENRKLSAVFQSVNLRETVGILDQLIAEYCDETDPDDIKTALKHCRNLPSAHTWWT